MGLPIKHRKKFVSHKKRWDKQTIVDEGVLVSDYALKNKKEIRRVELLLSKFKKIAKSFNKSAETKNSPQAKAFIDSLKAKGYLNPEATSLDEVLDITIRNLLERRLSNILYKHKLARTPAQARQFIVHRHVFVGDKMFTSPSYPVSLAQEPMVSFRGTSSLADENHPERKLQEENIEDLRQKEQVMPKPEKRGPNADEVEAKLDDEEQNEALVEK
ncbi:MAG: 30S ribosomal protein S4 [Nanoarchaeota archaeon]